MRLDEKAVFICEFFFFNMFFQTLQSVPEKFCRSILPHINFAAYTPRTLRRAPPTPLVWSDLGERGGISSNSLISDNYANIIDEE